MTNLTLEKLIKVGKLVMLHTNIWGDPKEYIAKFEEIQAEISRHYTNEQWRKLPTNTVLPTAIAEKYFQFIKYHNSIYPNFIME